MTLKEQLNTASGQKPYLELETTGMGADVTFRVYRKGKLDKSLTRKAFNFMIEKLKTKRIGYSTGFSTVTSRNRGDGFVDLYGYDFVKVVAKAALTFANKNKMTATLNDEPLTTSQLNEGYSSVSRKVLLKPGNV